VSRLRAVVLGARTVRQGLGPWVARTLNELGVDVRGVAGSSPETARDAARGLKERFDIDCRAHASAAEALDAERPDVVVICTPYEVHREHLELAAEAGTHTLCEKPLWWEPRASKRVETTGALVDAFRARGLHLSTLTQWPCTLPAWFELFGDPRPTFERFDMKLGPTRIDELAVVDSAPHALSLLECVLGPGDVEAVRWRADGDRGELTFAYDHRTGVTRCSLRLERHAKPPRPAGYGFDGHWAEREIEPSTYAMSFVAGDRRIPFPDPLRTRLSEFLASAEAGEPADREALVAAVRNLERLVASVSVGR